MTLLAAVEVGIATALVNSLWQVTGLAASAWLVLTLLDRRSAGLRHTVGMLFLTACALAPILTVVQVLTATEPPALALAPTVATVAPPGWLVWVWSVGVVWKLVRITASWRSFRRLEAYAFEPLPPPWQAKVERLRERFRIERPIDVRLTAGVLPCTARLVRPVIWMPATLLTRMPADQIEAVLAHELAHVRRCDWLWNGIQNAVDTLLFYHPGVWWLSRRIREERENACDDLAATACGDALVLAEAISRLEVLRAPTLVLSSQGGSLTKRIARLLMPEAILPARWTVSLAAFAIIGVAAALTLQSGVASVAGDRPRWWQLPGDAGQIDSTVTDDERSRIRRNSGHAEQHEPYVTASMARPIDAAARQRVAPPPTLPLPLHRISGDSIYRAAVREVPAGPVLIVRRILPMAIPIRNPDYNDSHRVNPTPIAAGVKRATRIQRIGPIEAGRPSRRTADSELVEIASRAR